MIINTCRPIGAAIELFQTIRSLRKHHSFHSPDGKEEFPGESLINKSW
jgi:hypothetical protein